MAKELGIQFSTGVELSCIHNGRHIFYLAYQIQEIVFANRFFVIANPFGINSGRNPGFKAGNKFYGRNLFVDQKLSQCYSINF